MRWLRRPKGERRRRSRLARTLIGSAVTLVVLVAGLGGYAGFCLYRIDHAVHHVEVPASLLARGHNDLLTLVRGPNHSEEAYLFHTTKSHTNILVLPTSLGIEVAGRTVPLSTLNVHTPAPIISGLHALGVPVALYVGVDLHMVGANTSLGRLATGKASVTSLISNPTGTASLLAAVASHVYLGPHTPVSALLELMHVPASHPVPVPTAKDDHGRVILAAPFVSVLRQFL